MSSVFEELAYQRQQGLISQTEFNIRYQELKKEQELKQKREFYRELANKELAFKKRGLGAYT